MGRERQRETDKTLAGWQGQNGSMHATVCGWKLGVRSRRLHRELLVVWCGGTSIEFLACVGQPLVRCTGVSSLCQHLPYPPQASEWPLRRQ